MPNEIIVHGGPELHSALMGLERDLRDMTALNHEVALEVAGRISGAAPRVSGALAGSFRGTGTKDKATVESDLIYAGVIENGWAEHNIDAQHYAAGAVEGSTADVVSTYENGVEKMTSKAEH